MTRWEPAALRSELNRPWRYGEHLMARGLACAEPVILDGLTLRGFDLRDARFAGGLSARGATFRGLSWLQGAKISGTCDLSGATFRTDLRLDGLSCDRLLLTGSRFEGVLQLNGAKILNLHLDRTCHLANVSMAEAEIGGLNLDGSEMLGGLWQEDARIEWRTALNLQVEGRLRADR